MKKIWTGSGSPTPYRPWSEERKAAARARIARIPRNPLCRKDWDAPKLTEIQLESKAVEVGSLVKWAEDALVVRFKQNQYRARRIGKVGVVHRLKEWPDGTTTAIVEFAFGEECSWIQDFELVQQSLTAGQKLPT